MKDETRDDDGGYTLIELMVVAVVAGMFMAIVYQVMTQGSQLFSRQAQVAESQMAGRFGMDVLAQDVMQAGYGATPNCVRDARIAETINSCDPFRGAGGVPLPQGILFRNNAAANNYGRAAAYNPQFQPDELWVMVNPYPGQMLDIAWQISGQLGVLQNTAADCDRVQSILNAPMLMIEERGARSFRWGVPTAQLSGTCGAGAIWTLTVNPPPATGLTVFDSVRGFGGSDARIGAVVWIRYYLKPVSTDGAKLDLVREVWSRPSGPPQSSDVVADEAVDFQVSFCLDTAYNPLLPWTAPNLNCDIEDEAVVNAGPEQIRTVTLKLRVRGQGEDATLYAKPDQPLAWYDLDGNRDNGVVPVRTLVRTVSTPNLAM